MSFQTQQQTLVPGIQQDFTKGGFQNAQGIYQEAQSVYQPGVSQEASTYTSGSQGQASNIPTPPALPSRRSNLGGQRQPLRLRTKSWGNRTADGWSGFNNTACLQEKFVKSNPLSTSPAAPPVPSGFSSRSWRRGPYKQPTLRTKDWGNRSENGWSNWNNTGFQRVIQNHESNQWNLIKQNWNQGQNQGQSQLVQGQINQAQLGQSQLGQSQLGQGQINQGQGQFNQQQFGQTQLGQQLQGQNVSYLPPVYIDTPVAVPYTTTPTTTFTTAPITTMPITTMPITTAPMLAAPIQRNNNMLVAPIQNNNLSNAGNKSRRQRRRLAKQTAIANTLQSRMTPPIGDPEVNHYRRGANAIVPVVGPGGVGAAAPVAGTTGRRRRSGRRNGRGSRMVAPATQPSVYNANPIIAAPSAFSGGAMGSALPNSAGLRRQNVRNALASSGGVSQAAALPTQNTLAQPLGGNSASLRRQNVRNELTSGGVSQAAGPTSAQPSLLQAPQFSAVQKQAQPLGGNPASLRRQNVRNELTSGALSSSGGVSQATALPTTTTTQTTLAQAPLYSAGLGQGQPLDGGLSQQPLYSNAGGVSTQQPLQYLGQRTL